MQFPGMLSMIGIMEKGYNSIAVTYTDSRINNLLHGAEGVPGVGYTRHYSQGEEFFLELEQSFEVPSFPIHHDVNQRVPGKPYLEALETLLRRLVPLVPGIFENLQWAFNPADTLRPTFFRLYRYKDQSYLFLLKLDLIFHPREGEITNKGTNDVTAAYSTRRLFSEADVFPLEQVAKTEEGLPRFDLRQDISQTWIGETGRGYFIQGIWIDRELTRFFSRLFLPKGKRVYPYYPFTCKLKTIGMTVISLDKGERERQIPYLERAVAFLRPRIDMIQKSVHDNPFSTDLEAFQQLKAKIPAGWDTHWDSLTVKPYLNQDNQKEYEIEGSI